MSDRGAKVTTDDMAPFVTDAAMSSLLRSPAVVRDMTFIKTTPADSFVLAKATARRGVVAQCDSREQYANCIQALHADNSTLPHGFVTRRCGVTNQLLSFVPYLVGAYGGEVVYAFHHKEWAKAVLLAVPDSAYLSNVHGFISATGNNHRFAGVCSFCGTPGSHRRCPCEAVHYCGTECQNLHWSSHKTVCLHL